MSAFGGKAQGLLRLRDEFRMPVPPFLVVPFADAIKNFESVSASITSAVENFFMTGNEDSLTAELRAITDGMTLNTAALDDIHDQIVRVGWNKVSFRTSAIVEDGPESSFAGQYESFVDVDYSREQLTERALGCFESMISLRVLRYARERQLANFEVGGSFIVQAMFYGSSSGVLFTENGSGALAVQAVGSWRNTVVEGDDAHEYLVEREHLSNAAVPAYIRSLCAQALEIEAKVGHPLDIEWSSDGNSVMFLQMRPITVPNLIYELDWDSTNISENYPGITLPLTYSVIRELYAGVYMSFFRLLGTSESLLQENEATFRNMLGYLNGQVYYRISNWYEVLKFLPGRANQEFFEAMLNPVVKRGGRAKSGRRLDAKSLFALVRFIWMLSRSQALSERFRKRFAKRLAFFKGYHVDYVNIGALLHASKRVRNDLLSEWAVPILNDVKLMVFHGLLKRYFFKDDHQTEYLAFLAGLNDRASLKPLEHLSRVGKAVAAGLKAEGVGSIEELKATPTWLKVVTAANEYVTAFGSRTPGELKLESVRLTDDITDVIVMALKAHESSFAAYADSHSADKAQQNQTLVWPAHVPRWQRPLLRWVAVNTRRAIDWRERFRFNRAQTFDLSRSMFDSVAKVFVQQGVLENPRDIYWMTEQEIDEIVNAHAWSLDAKPIVALRKAQFDTFSAMHMGLAMRGAGAVAATNLVEVKSSEASDGLGGKGVAPGVLTAEVVVCTEFDPNIDVRGKILVVHHIDPGWTLLFTQAAGIVAERGNALSHAAIIAREIGIPAVVAAPGVTSALKTGETITINGILGSITRESH